MCPRQGAKLRAVILLLICWALAMTVACKRGGKMIGKEYVYVSAPQVNLRDRLSAVYNKVGTVPNGQRLEVLEKSKRFYRVRAEGIGEGWVEERYLADQEIFDGFEKLAKDHAGVSSQSRGATRAELNMHLIPSRDGEHLFQLKEGEKVEVLQRTVTDKNAKALEAYQQQVQKLQQQIKTAATSPLTPEAKDTSATSSTPAKATTATVRPATAKPADAAAAQARLAKLPEPPPSIPEDWWLIRDSQKHVGWVLSRMIDVDVPLEVAQYAEGQRIVANFVINTVQDVGESGETKQVAQYLMLTTEPKDGQPFDYNHLRVFSWNGKRHRYETAYREHDLFGMFPVSVSHAVFDKEGDLPTFTVHVKNEAGQTIEKTYKMNGPMVRRVLSPAEEAAQKQLQELKLAERKAARDARIAQFKAAHPGKPKRSGRRR